MTRNSGQFRPGTSGNPRGRPPKSGAIVRHDAAAPPLPAARGATIRHDGYTNPATGHGTHRDARTLTGFRPDFVNDDLARLLRRSEFLCKRIIEVLPEEAMRRGWHLKLEDKEQAEKICKYVEDLGLDDVLVEAAQKEREAGGSAVFPVIDGAQGDLSTPLDEGAIGRINAFQLFEPRELYPIDYYADLEEPMWARPSVYMMTPVATGQASWIGAQPIHASRLIIFPGVKFTRQVMIGQRPSWGDSALTPVQQVLSDFGIAWGSAATLLQKHGKETWAVNRLTDMLRSKDGLVEFDRHVQATELAWSVLRMNVIDGADKIERSTGTLAGVHELLAEFKQLVAAAAETPVSILMGTTSSALRTGDDDTRAWYATVQKWRKKRFAPQHRRALRLCMLAGDSPTHGELPDLWSVEYPPLWEPDEKEHAERLKTDMERAQIAITAGVASADDIAESFYGGDTYSGDIVIDWDRRAAQKKIDEEAAAQLQQDQAALAAMGRTQAGQVAPTAAAPALPTAEGAPPPGQTGADDPGDDADLQDREAADGTP